MDEVLKHLSNICAIDHATLGIIGVLCGAAAYVLKEYLANPIMVIFVYPILFALSVLVQYCFILGEMFPPRKLDQWLMWTVMASICGTILGITLVAWLGRLHAAVRASRPFTPIPRAQDRR